MRVIGYTRVSSHSLSQIKALENHKGRLIQAGCTELYWDIASRSKNDREDLNTVLDLIQRRECDKVIFIRLDRMTDNANLLEQAIQICLASGIPIVGLDDNIDFETVGGRLQARILCSLARAEVERLSERVRRGYEHIRNRNMAFWPPFGYKRVEGRMELNHDPYLCLIDGQRSLSQAEIGRELVATYLEIKTFRGTLRWLNETYGIQQFARRGRANRKARQSLGFTSAGLSSWLTNPILRGHTSYGRTSQQQPQHKDRWDIRHNTHPEHVLMTEDEYQAIEQILQTGTVERGWKPARVKKVNPLSGLVYCGQCQGYCKSIPYRLHPDDCLHYYYQCKTYSLSACSQKRSVKGYVIEEAIIQALIQRAEAVNAIAQEPQDQEEPPELQALRAELAYYLDAPSERATALVTDLRLQIESWERRLRAAAGKSMEQRDLLLQVFGDSLYWKTLMDEEKQEIYRALVERVIVKDGQVDRVELRV